MLRVFSTRLQYRLMIFFALVLLIPTTVIGAYTYNTGSTPVLERAQQTALNELQIIDSRLEDAFARVIPDLEFLSSAPFMERYDSAVNAGDEAARSAAIADISTHYLRFIETMPSYDQIRLLDAKGLEVVRVNQTRPHDPNTLPYIVPAEELQDKSNRDYFVETIKLRQGEIFISKLNLNQEQGKFEVPYKPVIRFATPVFDANGTLLGVVIVNMLGKPVLSLVNLGQAEGAIYLVDQEGTYLAAPDDAQEFGVDLKTGASFLADHPADGATMMASDQPFVGFQGDRIVLYTNVSPPGLRGIQWTLYATHPSAPLFAEVNSIRTVTFMVAMFSLAGAIFLAALLARSITRPVQELAAASHQIADGKLNVPLPKAKTSDEIGDLTQAFGKMTRELDRTYTDLKKRAQELQVANALTREANRLKSEFLATMSHELRTPLNAMIGFNELMLKGASGPLTDKQTHHLKRMHANSLRLLALIDDVLDLSRIEAGRVEIVHQPFSLREMNERLVSQTSSLVVGKAFHFSTSIDSALPDRLLGDQDHLEEVLLNLLSNAFKFTAQGEVELRYAYVPDANQWTLSVRDTGIGIPPHALEYIFEEFRQADGSSRRAYGGSGLGLAISRHLCRLMDGDITVQSTVGVGSTFTIKLPFTAAPAEASAEAASTPANSNHGFNGNGTRELVHA